MPRLRLLRSERNFSSRSAIPSMHESGRTDSTDTENVPRTQTLLQKDEERTWAESSGLRRPRYDAQVGRSDGIWIHRVFERAVRPHRVPRSDQRVCAQPPHTY